MGYGALVVGHQINLNQLAQEQIDDVEQMIRDVTNGELWVAGGEFLEWERPGAQIAPAFVCKGVSFVDEMYGGTNSSTISESRLEQMRTWLRDGLPGIAKVRASLDERFALFMPNEASVYLVLSGVNATTSTDLFFGTEGYLSLDDPSSGWSLELFGSHNVALEEINKQLAGPKYSVTKDAFQAEMARIGEDEGIYEEFVSDKKYDVICFLEKYNGTIMNFYDDEVSSWSVIFGSCKASVYKDTHTSVSPHVLNTSTSGQWMHRTYMSG